MAFIAHLKFWLAYMGLAMVLLSCQNRGENASVKDLPEVVDFNFHIKPILSDRCYHCHGPDENSREALLRLDVEEGALGSGESGSRAITPRKPHKSEVFKRVTSHDTQYQMPPAETGLVVSDYEIALIEKWIKQGATWKDHWAFIPPQKTDLPEVQLKEWPSNEIDYFLLAKLEQANVSPSQEATRETLIRRLTFDLTGLPPTLEEVDAFLADNSPVAYENVVDRLLASEKYGERMAVDWLNVARYGDTHGYEADSKRMAWPWRDWVINAFNQNMPYDRFIKEQLAGDLLPSPTRDQLIATAFNRNHLMNSENGIIDEEWRVEYVSDRTNTAGKALLGLTMECAKCHDHKYDPISQKEYFGMFAFFNNVDEPGQIRYESQAYPVINLTTDVEQQQLDELDQLIASKRQDVTRYISQLKRDHTWKTLVDKKIEIERNLDLYVPFEKLGANSDGDYFANLADAKRPVSFSGDVKFVDGPIGRALAFDGTNQVLLKDSKNSFGANEAFSYSFWATFPEPFQMARLMGTEDGNFDLVPGYYLFIEDDKLSVQLCNTWDHNYIKVTTQNSFPFKQWTHITITYDGSMQASGIKVYLDGHLQALDVIQDALTKQLNTSAWFTIGHSTLQGGALDEFRQYSRVLTLPEIQELAGQVVSDEGWFDYYTHNQDEGLASWRDDLRNMLAQRMSLLDSIPQLMVMKDIDDEVRATHILNRGIYDDLGEEVDAHTPEAVLAFSESLPQNRLGFAEWLFTPAHPLTSRVMVNRMWQMMFGKGLVATPDDFGNQGALPTHPELLDWLAVYFRESGWDIKATYKTIVMSSGYRQTSAITPELLELDPNNDLLARGPRYRLASEMIRDNALAVSRLLVDSIGGEPVKPYQPAGIWAQVSSLGTAYDQDHGDKLYRRSLYTYWKRAVPPPNMITLDAPTRHVCTIKREATSTPLQALVLLNDVQFVEAARLFAERLLKERGKSLEERITYAFRLGTARYPTRQELAVLQSLYLESKKEFETHPHDIQELLNTGEYPTDKSLNPLELAAYTTVTSAILNMNETITKG